MLDYLRQCFYSALYVLAMVLEFPSLLVYGLADIVNPFNNEEEEGEDDGQV